MPSKYTMAYNGDQYVKIRNWDGTYYQIGSGFGKQDEWKRLDRDDGELIIKNNVKKYKLKWFDTLVEAEEFALKRKEETTELFNQFMGNIAQ